MIGQKLLKVLLCLVLAAWIVTYFAEWWVARNSHTIGCEHGPRKVAADSIHLKCGDLVFYRSGHRCDILNFSYLDHVGIVVDDNETIADFTAFPGLKMESKLHTLQTISKKTTILVRQLRSELSETQKKQLADYVEECKEHEFDSRFIFVWILNTWGVSMLNDSRRQNCTSFVYNALQKTHPNSYRNGRTPQSIHISEYSSTFPLLSKETYYDEIELDHSRIPRFFCG